MVVVGGGMLLLVMELMVKMLELVLVMLLMFPLNSSASWERAAGAR